LNRATDAAMVATRALVAIAARSLNELDDVTLPQYRALVLLASHGPGTTGQLAARLGVNPSTVTRLVDRLVAKGLVARSIGGDRREVVLTAEAAALELLRAVTEVRRRELEVVMARIPAGEREAVVRAFDAFAVAAGELADDQWSVVLNPAVPSTPPKRSSLRDEPHGTSGR
jgi:DNA-binding MarR family transcriptional regulator